MNIPQYETALKSALGAGMSRDDAHEAALQATRQQAQPAAAKHTPAPWAVSMPGGQTTFNGRRVTVTSRGNMVADLDWNSPAENLANARLIASAPTLLRTLQDIVSGGNVNCGAYWKIDAADIAKAQAAIAQATGA